MTAWSFEADYFTACNCDWGCPCNFNARSTEGRCMGWGVWTISSGKFGDTPLDGCRFALYYTFPGEVAGGGGTACAYIDDRTDPAQQRALEAIATGKAGGGIFELFGAELVTKWLPAKVVRIDVDVVDGAGRVRIADVAGAESELLSYPDGTVIEPWLDLPHGIEFKRGLMTNARRWWWRDRELDASYENKYGAAARVKFSEQGCIA